MNLILKVLRTETLEKDLYRMSSSPEAMSTETGNGQVCILGVILIVATAGLWIREVDLPRWASFLSMVIVTAGAIRLTTRLIRVLDLQQVLSELARRRAIGVQMPSKVV